VVTNDDGPCANQIKAAECSSGFDRTQADARRATAAPGTTLQSNTSTGAPTNTASITAEFLQANERYGFSERLHKPRHGSPPLPLSHPQRPGDSPYRTRSGPSTIGTPDPALYQAPLQQNYQLSAFSKRTIGRYKIRIPPA
jgi:hypothetical protein